jgi:outer membrane protein assembly factor BamB
LLAVELNAWNGNGGTVSEFDRDGKVRWRIEHLLGPADACVLPGDRVLIAEQNANRVTERDSTGKILWEYSVAMPFQCQRLRNGNTFIAGRNLLIEVDSKKREVFSYRSLRSLSSARRFRDGQSAFLTQLGDYVRLDAAGKEVNSFRLSLRGTANYVNAEVLPGDRVLVCLGHLNKVGDYDSSGKPAWEAAVTMPANPTRLSNGNTLVASNTEARVTELDRLGRVVAEWKNLPVNPTKVYRR